jgi:hypothetical protein
VGLPGASVESGEANVGYANLLRIADALEVEACELVRAALVPGRITRKEAGCTSRTWASED